MAATAINTSTFYRFTRLAPEIRNQIWRATFQDEAGPVLYFYKKGSWCPRPLLPSDPGYGYDPENDESTLVFKFYHDVLDSVQVEMPLFLVNREARDVAQSWMGEHGIKIRVYRGIDGQLQPPGFVRPFDLVHDALYIAPDKWDEFLCEPDNRCFQPDMMEKYIQVYAADITRIAIPEALFRGGGDLATALPELMVVINLFSSLYLYFLT